MKTAAGNKSKMKERNMDLLWPAFSIFIMHSNQTDPYWLMLIEQVIIQEVL